MKLSLFLNKTYRTTGNFNFAATARIHGVARRTVARQIHRLIQPLIRRTRRDAILNDADKAWIRAFQVLKHETLWRKDIQGLLQRHKNKS